MFLYVSDIKATGQIQKEEELDPSVLFGPSSESVRFDQPVWAQVKAQMTQSDIYVTGDIKTAFTLKCARCLNQFEKPFQGKFSQTFNPTLEKIELSNDIRETVLIDVPMKALCRDGCKGLCASCGKDLNIESCGCKKTTGSKLDQQLKNFPFQKS